MSIEETTGIDGRRGTGGSNTDRPKRNGGHRDIGLQFAFRVQEDLGLPAEHDPMGAGRAGQQRLTAASIIDCRIRAPTGDGCA